MKLDFDENPSYISFPYFFDNRSIETDKNSQILNTLMIQYEKLNTQYVLTNNSD